MNQRVVPVRDVAMLSRFYAVVMSNRTEVQRSAQRAGFWAKWFDRAAAAWMWWVLFLLVGVPALVFVGVLIWLW